MKKTNNRQQYDENIITALQALKNPLTSFDGNKVYFDDNKRDESLFEHIANKRHRFKITDIKKIPDILKDKKTVCCDKKKKVFRNYIGRRTKKNDKLKYIKIITRIVGVNKETIISIYLVKEKG